MNENHPLEDDFDATQGLPPEHAGEITPRCSRYRKPRLRRCGSIELIRFFVSGNHHDSPYGNGWHYWDY